MGKHFEEKHNKPKKRKITIILICLLLLCISIIIIYFIKNFKSEEIEIKNIIDNTFIALKVTNVEEVNEHLDYNKLVSSLDNMILEENKGTISNLEKQLFNSMEWKINSINIKENEIIANIEMKNKDFKEILTKWIENIIEEKQKKTNISKDMALQILENIVLENKSKKMVTKDIKLEKQEDNFEIIVDNELRDLIFTGISSVATVINEN